MLEVRFFLNIWRLDYVEVVDANDDSLLQRVLYVGPLVLCWHTIPTP